MDDHIQHTINNSIQVIVPYTKHFEICVWGFYLAGDFHENSYSGDQSTQEVNAISEYLRLSRLKKTASGPDDIPYWAFKECAFKLAPIITHIINISLKAGVVPRAWKKAYVSPVPKVKNPSEFSGYADLRPISVTPILSRLVEKIVVKKYLWPLMDNEQMVDQFAFKPTGSTTAALVELLHLFHNMFDQGNDYVRCILIDFSKAFDVWSITRFCWRNFVP